MRQQGWLRLFMVLSMGLAVIGCGQHGGDGKALSSALPTGSRQEIGSPATPEVPPPAPAIPPPPLPPQPSPQPPAQDTTPPSVSDVAPVSGAVNVLSWELVSQKKNVSVVFSEHVDLSTVTTGSLVLDPPAVVESVGIASSQVVHFILSALQPATSYQVTFKKNGVKDFAGNPLASDFQWQFKTVACGNGYGQVHCPPSPADNAQIEAAPSGGSDIQPEMAQHPSSWVAEEYIIRPIGTGRLDTDKVVTCPDHYGVVEMTVRGGDILDQITRIGCRNIFHLDPNDHSPAAAVKYVDVSIGGGGGGEVTFKPYDNHVFTGWWTKTVPWDGAPGYFVGEFVPMASPVLGHLGVVSVINQQMSGGMTSVGNAGGYGPDYSYVPLRCPKGYFVKGVIGGDDQSGYVKRLGAVCQRLALLGQPTSGKISLYDGNEFGPLEGIGLGGARGAYFRADCPAGMAVIGLEGRHGDIVDAFTKLNCRMINAAGDPTGQVAGAPIEGGGGPGGGYYIYQASQDITNGYVGQTLLHVSGEVLSGWRISRRFYDGDWIVAMFRPWVSYLDPSGTVLDGSSTFGYAGQGMWYKGHDTGLSEDEQAKVEIHETDHRCPEGYVLTGIKGLAGDYVSSLGGICHKIN